MARPHTPAKAESWVEASRVNSATRGGRTPRPTLGNLEAYVRVRPNPVGNQMSTITLHDDEANVTVRLASARSGPLGMGRTFSFDRTFGEQTTQDEIFDIVAAPLCDAALDGYAAKQLDGPVCICDLERPDFDSRWHNSFNATIFAYGQTGSGKTFTMHGGATTGDARGLMVRAVERILKGMQQRPQARYALCASYVQLYNEIPTDCLRDPPTFGNPPALRVRELDGGRTHVENLLHEPIVKLADATRLIAKGAANRTTAATATNAESSRAHAVFTLKLKAELTGADGTRRARTTSLHLVDLAGVSYCQLNSGAPFAPLISPSFVKIRTWRSLSAKRTLIRRVCACVRRAASTNHSRPLAM